MLYDGSKLSVKLTDGIAVLCFDAKEGSVNKFDQATLQELEQATARLAQTSHVKGLLVTSRKAVFIVGADIMEFGELFKHSADDMRAWLADTNSIFSAIEDLPFPSLTAING